WKIPCMQPASKEWTGFPTQKHHELLERILLLGSNEGDLVADFFCGSGTTLLTAEKLNRRWIGCDISKFSIYLTKKRIMNHHQNIRNGEEIRNKFRILTHLTDEKEQTINSGFFEKNIKFKRH
ncbi:MAG: DNA methyltransferase, partial [Promethearchaeota archaeon]